MDNPSSGEFTKILTLSDVEVPVIHSAKMVERFGNTDLIICCGDLSYEYMEYALNRLDVPLYFVRGNHSKPVEHESSEPLSAPRGGIDLHRRAIKHQGLLLAGIEGSLRYREGPYQYSQREMWFLVFLLVPRLLLNRVRYGRFLDIFVTHAPPWGIHDQTDLTHQGIQAFRWLLRVFQPAYHFHGHIHVYRPDTVTQTRFKGTWVINTYGYRQVEVKIP